MEEKDLIIGISSSGNSKNVVKALEYANNNRGITVVISGFPNGKIDEISNVSIDANISDMEVSEDVHLVLFHLAKKHAKETRNHLLTIILRRTGFRRKIPSSPKNPPVCSDYPNIELIWASPRELLNIFQAESVGCHIITATNDILRKLDLIGKNLTEYSLDTVKMFYSDAHRGGFTL